MHLVDATPDDRVRYSFTAPGLTLRWEKLPPILDRLAVSGITQLTVDQLRFCVDSSR